jgi:catechol 2,3-dioxygenase-like lactoylglutathione lyase family enzyme
MLKLDSIQIFVGNLEEAKKWYHEVLGMEIVEEYPEIKSVLMKLGDFKFYIETPCPEWGEGWDKVKVGGRTPIIFVTKDIYQTVKELKQKGVKFVEEISKRPWGEYKAVFADPWGNEFNLVEDKTIEKIRELKGANMDIDLSTPEDKIHWKQDKCPWNEKERTNKHKCAVKNVSICKYFRGIKVTKENPDIVLCAYPEEES